MSFFKGPYSLSQQYADLTYTQINTATNQATAILLCTLQNASTLCFLFNSLDQDLRLYLVNPAVAQVNSQVPADPSQLSLAANRLFWMEFPKNYNINYDGVANPSYFEPGTRIYVSLTAGSPAATAGKFRVVLG